ncbi:ARL14 effector protein [Aplysia californica]|uniref:ARL14 effector protein n=1 Tax=Aplysia californica TaxID=6500 RepID=A0ABM0JF08_APLCA|nr:ARL14 effector protein [Aplysia californica]
MNLDKGKNKLAPKLTRQSSSQVPPVSEEKTGKRLRSRAQQVENNDSGHALRKLSFSNPGKFMEDFNPEQSTRELRKLKRKLGSNKVHKNRMYNADGLLIDNGADWCDCLEVDCPGCHFPCPKCNSCKCGAECRLNRKWCYDVVEIDGSLTVYKWSFQPNPQN